MSAPSFSRIRTISICPLQAATCSGVSSFESFAWTFAPLASRIRTTSRQPFQAAMCRAVLPYVWILCVDVCSSLDQGFDCLDVALIGGVHQLRRYHKKPSWILRGAFVNVEEDLFGLSLFRRDAFSFAMEERRVRLWGRNDGILFALKTKR